MEARRVKPASSAEASGESTGGSFEVPSGEMAVDFLQLQALACTAEPGIVEAVQPSLAVWEGKPKSASWCTWFQKVASAIGYGFDGKTTPGRQALQRWLGMTDTQREEWKSSYLTFCAEKSVAKPSAATAEAPPSVEPLTATPPKAQPAVELPSPQTGEKRALQPAQKPEARPRFEDRTPTLHAFEKRWAFLKKELKKAGPNSGFFLQRAADFYLLYLDVVHLLEQGEWDGKVTKAANALQAFHVNKVKIGRVRKHLAEAKQAGEQNVVPRCFAAGTGGRRGGSSAIPRANVAKSSHGVTRGSRRLGFVFPERFIIHSLGTLLYNHSFLGRSLWHWHAHSFPEAGSGDTRHPLCAEQQTPVGCRYQEVDVPLLAVQLQPG